MLKKTIFLAGFIASAALAQTELLGNNGFDDAVNYDWSVSSGAKGTIKMVAAVGGGYDVSFVPSATTTLRYDLQLVQTGITVRPGYRYSVLFGGVSTGAYGRSIQLGIQNAYDYTTYLQPVVSITTTYADYKTVSATNSWDNCSVTDDNVQFFVNGGASTTPFKLAWVSLVETPITCGASSSSTISSSSGGTGVSSSSASPSNGTAYVNQVGLLAGAQKQLVLLNGTNDPLVFFQGGTAALSVNPGTASTWAPSGQSVRRVDFSALATAGTYTVKQGSTTLRTDIHVAPAPYENLLKGVLKWYYYQRASLAIQSPYAASSYVRSLGHGDAAVTFHNSTGKTGTLNSPKGWYDAGDYGKYIVNSGITTYTLLALYNHYPQYFKTLSLNIPESGGTLPDLLAEIKWNLDWMLTMQASDGGVYHKITSAGFTWDGMPGGDPDTRYVIGKSTAASYDFAAVMAMASRVYASFDATYAATCLSAAESAFAWAEQNPNKKYTNAATSSPAISTGEYRDDGDLRDERLFAATGLSVATGKASYVSVASAIEPIAKVPDWQTVAGLAVYEAFPASAILGNYAALAKDTLLKVADSLVAAQSAGYGVPMRSSDYVWGSNAVAGNQGILLLHAYYSTGAEKYYQAAVAALDYLLGRNPLNRSFVTGFGSATPSYPHHRISESDGVAAPVPGMLVGGPQNDDNPDIGSNAWECSNYKTTAPALSYKDHYCSYATNEVAINWNASIAYLAGALQAMASGHKSTIGLATPNPDPDPTPDPDPDAVRAPAPAVAHPTRPLLRFDGTALRIERNGQAYSVFGKKISR